MAELVPDEESRMRRRRRRGASWIRRSARSFWHAAPCCPKKTRARRRHARQMGSDRAIGATPTARFSPGGLLERQGLAFEREFAHGKREPGRDRKSTRLNSSHSQISYAVFCLKKKKTNNS